MTKPLHHPGLYTAEDLKRLNWNGAGAPSPEGVSVYTRNLAQHIHTVHVHPELSNGRTDTEYVAAFEKSVYPLRKNGSYPAIWLDERVSETTPTSGRSTLFDLTAVQAVRLLGELTQEGDGLTEAQYLQLQESTDLKRDQIDNILDRASDLWDEIKGVTAQNAPQGEHTPTQVAVFMADVAHEELQ